MEAKFNYGDKVLINGNIVGIVLFSYNMFRCLTILVLFIGL